MNRKDKIKFIEEIYGTGHSYVYQLKIVDDSLVDIVFKNILNEAYKDFSHKLATAEKNLKSIKDILTTLEE